MISILSFGKILLTFIGGGSAGTIELAIQNSIIFHRMILLFLFIVLLRIMGLMGLIGKCILKHATIIASANILH